MTADPTPPAKNEPAPDVSLQPDANPDAAAPETTNAQEWGERYDHAKGVARGGKETGPVPGAERRRGSGPVADLCSTFYPPHPKKSARPAVSAAPAAA